MDGSRWSIFRVILAFTKTTFSPSCQSSDRGHSYGTMWMGSGVDTTSMAEYLCSCWRIVSLRGKGSPCGCLCGAGRQGMSGSVIFFSSAWISPWDKWFSGAHDDSGTPRLLVCLYGVRVLLVMGRMNGESFDDEATLGRGLSNGEVGSCLSLRHMPAEGTEIVCKARRWRQKSQSFVSFSLSGDRALKKVNLSCFLFLGCRRRVGRYNVI